MSTLTGPEIAAAGLADWALLRRSLHTRLVTRDFATGLRLVDRIGAAAEAADHHPDLDLRYTYVDVRLTSHDVGGVTSRDVSLARSISELAADEGVAAEPAVTKLLELGLDTPDAASLAPFWRAVLGARDAEGEVYDDVLPTLWFQESGSDEPRQRFHLDLWVTPDVVQDRIAAAVGAGGQLVSDAEAPAFWVLADPEGNKVCLCTWQSRDAD